MSRPAAEAVAYVIVYGGTYLLAGLFVAALLAWETRRTRMHAEYMRVRPPLWQVILIWPCIAAVIIAAPFRRGRRDRPPR